MTSKESTGLNIADCDVTPSQGHFRDRSSSSSILAMENACLYQVVNLAKANTCATRVFKHTGILLQYTVTI